MGWGQHGVQKAPTFLTSFSFFFLFDVWLFISIFILLVFFASRVLGGGIIEDLVLWIFLKIIAGDCLGPEKSKQIEKSWIKSGLARRESVVYHGMVWQMPRRNLLHIPWLASLLRILKKLPWFDGYFLDIYCGSCDVRYLKVNTYLWRIYSCLSDGHIPHYSH